MLGNGKQCVRVVVSRHPRKAFLKDLSELPRRNAHSLSDHLFAHTTILSVINPSIRGTKKGCWEAGVTELPSSDIVRLRSTTASDAVVRRECVDHCVQAPRRVRLSRQGVVWTRARVGERWGHPRVARRGGIKVEGSANRDTSWVRHPPSRGRRT